jgi:amino acid adenylation domain-containing protein
MSPFPLSPLQESRWRLVQAEPHGPWSCSLTLELQGPLEPEAVRAALTRLVARHEILRTRFVRQAAAEAPGMEVEPAGAASLECLDWRSLTRVERELESRRLEQRLRAPYAMDGSAPLAAALARVTEAQHVLVLAQSALATDWRSLWSLARELVRSLAGDEEREAPAQFADLAQWLRDALEGDDAGAGRKAWQDLDLGAAMALRLPLEHDRGAGPNVGPFVVHELTRELPPRLHEALSALAEGRRLPKEAVLGSLWLAWLARLGELDSLVAGVRSAGRAFQGLDEALGPFERFLPVQVRFDERVSLAQLARRTDEQLARGAEWHEHFEPGGPGAPADFAFHQAFEFLPAEPAFAQGALSAEILRRDGHGERFRALLRAEETATGCELRLAYDARWLAEADAAALLEPWLVLLENALARPDAPLASLALTGPESHAQVLALSRGPELAPDPRPEPRAMHEWILETARARPEAVAVVAGGAELGYRALEERSGALAAELEALGVGPGTMVGVHLERSVELVVALVAVLRAGGAYVPLPPSYPRERVLTMLADSKAAVLIGTAASRAALEGFRGTLVDVHEPRATPAVAPRARVAPSERAYVIYTSGSSGKPKGVPITHANLVHSTRARLAAYPERVTGYLLLSSFAFDSSVAGIFWTLVQGGTLVLPPEGFEKDLTQLPGLIARHRPSHLLGLPSLWSLVLDTARAGELDSLTNVIVAGESCPLELVRRHHATLPRTRLHNEYGPTEGTVWSTVFDTGTPFERAQVPIGRPIPGTTNYVLTPARELAPVGLAGELWIGGPGVASGYLERPELSAERFADDPFTGGRMYRTGDRARWLSDGNLEFLGRLDHQVKIRGYRIELEEIEAVLGAHPAVREALVVAREDGGATRLVAYVLPSGPRPAETDLLRYLGERLPEYMVPARALCLGSWPTLPNGKVDRKALPAPDEAQGFAEPEGALEVVVAVLFADVLGLEQVGRHDDFFALGGHSLSATRLYARLRETLQTRLPLRALFESRTPAQLAAELGREPVERARVERLAEHILAVLESEEERALGA